MGPVALECTGPLVDRADCLSIGAIELVAAVAADMDEVNVAEDAQMLGDRGLIETHGHDEVADGEFAGNQESEDFAAARFGDSVECVGCGRSACHEKKQYILIWEYVKYQITEVCYSHPMPIANLEFLYSGSKAAKLKAPPDLSDVAAGATCAFPNR